MTAAQASGAQVIGLRTLEPMNPAAAITLRVKRPASYLQHSLERFTASLPSAADERYEGLYIRIVDRAGRFVWYSAAMGGDAISAWSSGARRDLRGCDPTPTYGGLGDKGPPPSPDG